VTIACLAVFLSGGLYAYYRSSDWIKWKDVSINGEIRNARFEEWVPFPPEEDRGDLPDYWRVEGGTLRRVENANPARDGRNAVKVVSMKDRGATLSQEIPIQSYCGGVVKVTARVWADHPKGAMITLTDGAAEVTSYHSGQGGFEDLSVAFKVDNSVLLQGRRKLTMSLKTPEGEQTAIFSNVRLNLLTRQTVFPVHRDDPISFVFAF
jgi:hypothetical protein